MAWLLIVIAGLFEPGFAVLLKQSHGLTRLWPTIEFAVCALISFGLLNLAPRQVDVGPLTQPGPGSVLPAPPWSA